jgi:hypothetical protein
MSDESTAPIVHDYRLSCSSEHAFATYTERVGEWWDARYTANAGTLEAVTIEPRVGGRVYATHHGGWTEAASRKKFGDWPVMLDRFAALAERP